MNAVLRNSLQSSIIAILLILGTQVSGMELVDTVHDRGFSLNLTLLIRDFPEEDILMSLNEGYRSEVIFTIRTVQRRLKGLPFFNEEILMENILSITAFRDPFLGEYTMTLPQGGMATFSDPKLFLQFLGQLTSYPLQPIPPHDPQEYQYFLQVRAEVVPILLVPPLNLLTLFSGRYRKHTPWKTIPLVRPPQ